MASLPRLSKWKYYLMLIVINSIGRLPLRWRYGIARFVADRVYDWGPRIGPNVRDNVRHVLGALAAYARRTLGTGLVVLARLLGGFLAYHAGVDDLEFLGVALLVYVVSMTIYRLKLLGGSR